jgi:hypothetical protein
MGDGRSVCCSTSPACLKLLSLSFPYLSPSTPLPLSFSLNRSTSKHSTQPTITDQDERGETDRWAGLIYPSRSRETEGLAVKERERAREKGMEIWKENVNKKISIFGSHNCNQ